MGNLQNHDGYQRTVAFVSEPLLISFVYMQRYLPENVLIPHCSHFVLQIYTSEMQVAHLKC